jgi:hypothetical protein
MGWLQGRLCQDQFGQPTDIPITGKWSAVGMDRIGVFRPDTGRWYLDRSGNEKWNGCDWDFCARLKIYQAGDLPVTGDWNGGGRTQVGLFRPATGEWFLDSNGNFTWDGCSKDRCLSSFALQPICPCPGIGTEQHQQNRRLPSEYRQWFLDFNGNGQWTAAAWICASRASATPRYSSRRQMVRTGRGASQALR